MAEVLDYSSGWPDPRVVRQAGYGGVVRYIGTPGRGKNLTPQEARALRVAGVPVALVYEDTAGWMLAGSRAGVAAARAVELDAARCGVELRCCYLACDQDVVTRAQMANVMACLDGAGTVWGLAVTGVYGGLAVVDAALQGHHAMWGWQTVAWSRGEVSALAHLYQHAGYVSVGGVQCDRNSVLRDDWGQVPRPGAASEGDDVPLTDQDTTKIARTLAADMTFRLAVRGELIAALSDPGHQYMRDDIVTAERPMADEIAAQFSAVSTSEGSLASKVDGLAASLSALRGEAGSGVDLDALAGKVVDQLVARLARPVS